MLGAKLKGVCPWRQEPSRAAPWHRARRPKAGGKHPWEGWDVSASHQPNCPVAASLLEAEHCWHCAENLPLPLPADWGSAMQHRHMAAAWPAEDTCCRNTWLREANGIFPRKSVYCTHFIDQELRHRLLKGLGQLCTTSPEQAQLPASTVFAGFLEGPLPDEHLTLFSIKVPTLLFGIFLYAFCIP